MEDINMPQPEGKTIDEAKKEIEVVWGMIAQFGAVSNERDLLDNLIANMESYKITPEEAVRQAHQIMHDKNGFDTHYR